MWIVLVGWLVGLDGWVGLGAVVGGVGGVGDER